MVALNEQAGNNCRRDTMAAVLLAAVAAGAEDSDAVLAVMPSDHMIKEDSEFRTAIVTAADHVAKAGIAVIGVMPHQPSTAYGYIKPAEDQGNGAFKVARFVEKPDEPTAVNLIAQHCLWNAGIFCFRAGWLMICSIVRRGLSEV